ncbi:hypothetical protein ACQ86N_15755 [Puia sp. P3]|uniref:hypothetical protein n=1 Tax=Puia sp. P3 TaxID=3423952 RepID=UPI003D6645C0
MKNSDKGFNCEGVVTLDNPGAGRGQMQLFAGDVRGLPGVSEAILQGHAPMGREHPTAAFVHRYADMKGMHETKVEVEIGDFNFIPFYRMRLIAGGNVRKGENIPPVVINETYARMLGFSDPKDALGNQLLYRENGLWYTICGVVKDYHQTSFHETIRPLIIITWVSDAKSVAIRLGVHGDAAKRLMGELAAKWRSFFRGCRLSPAHFRRRSTGCILRRTEPRCLCNRRR